MLLVRMLSIGVVLTLLLSLILCQSPLAVAQTVPSHNHVILIAFENHSYEGVVGDTTDMPYFNSLINEYGLAGNFYANVHGSLANYYWVTMGTSICATSVPGGSTCTDGTIVTANKKNLVTVLNNLGLTWKSYQENIQQTGELAEGNDLPTDCNGDGSYVPRHNPFVYFTEVRNGLAAGATCTSNPSALLDCVNNPNQAGCNVVSFASSNFQSDLENQNLPNFSFITPNMTNDAHDGSYAGGLQAADAWMSTNVQNILDSHYFHSGGDGLLILWWDEGDLGTDNHCSSGVTGTDPESGIDCGGHIAVVVIAPDGNRKYQSTTYYQHPSILRTVLEALGVSPSSQTNFPGASLSASHMAEFFTGPKVTVTTPRDLLGVSSPVNIQASATPSSGQSINGWKIYVDDVDSGFSPGAVSSINTNVTMSSGVHTVLVRAWDTTVAETFGDQTLFVSVGGPLVTVSTPANNATVSSPVNIQASATPSSGNTIDDWRIYVDGQDSGFHPGAVSSINTNVTMSVGTHTVIVRAWDTSARGFFGDKTLTLTVH